jgi:hypothetical protein
MARYEFCVRAALLGRACLRIGVAEDVFDLGLRAVVLEAVEVHQLLH